MTTCPHCGCEFEATGTRAKRRPRSLGQNAWHWGVALPMIAEAMGYDRHERGDRKTQDDKGSLHYDLVGEWGGRHLSPMQTWVNNRRSSKLTTAEFSDFMEWEARWAAEKHHIYLPMPDELRFGPQEARA